MTANTTQLSAKRRRVRLALVAVAGVLVIAGAAGYSIYYAPVPSAAECGRLLDRPTLEASLDAGAAFLVARQKPAGNFGYEVDWRTGRESPDDNGVRQAGAVWGLALVRQARTRVAVDEALDRAFAFFAAHTRRRDDGATYVIYPGENEGALGTVALLALAYADALRGPPLPDDRAARYRERLDGFVRFLLAARNPEGLFFGNYSQQGVPSGEPSPYSDGEALLALATVARYHGRADLRADLAVAADAAYRTHVTRALAAERDSDETKGFYQWGSMAFYELATGDWPEFEPYAARVLDLADWMLDTHRVLYRMRNTGYAFEGILHATDLARRRHDPRAARFACDAERGLTRLTGWQVGGPRPNGYVTRHGPPPPTMTGGVQNEADAPTLRIDVTQHQMHAVALALKWLVPSESESPGP